MMVGWFALTLAFAAPSAEDEAEARRLSSELAIAADRSAWSGADRLYRQLMALEVPASNDAHLLGAQAAMDGGDLLHALWRLQRTERLGVPSAERERIDHDIRYIESRFSLISLTIGEGRLPVITRSGSLFDPREKAAVVFARNQLGKNRSFTGLLPLGKYQVDGKHIEVKASDSVLFVEVP